MVLLVAACDTSRPLLRPLRPRATIGPALRRPAETVRHPIARKLRRTIPRPSSLCALWAEPVLVRSAAWNESSIDKDAEVRQFERERASYAAWKQATARRAPTAELLWEEMYRAVSEGDDPSPDATGTY